MYRSWKKQRKKPTGLEKRNRKNKETEKETTELVLAGLIPDPKQDVALSAHVERTTHHGFVETLKR